VLSVWKPAFMHSDQATRLVRAVIVEAGFAAETTHYDVPKPRTSYPVGHLTTGIAFAFPWHRDTWYGAPYQQINWWLPVFPIREDNAMSFDLPSFGKAVANSSATFDYYRNNVARLQTGSQVDKERQCRPAAIDHEPAGECVVLPAPGSILLFSGAQLHRSIPNTSGRARYSVDFRTVDVTDVDGAIGAPSIDVQCSGTAIRDFRRVEDDALFDEEEVVRWFGPPPEDAMLVFSGADDT
jgi:ectoine hydroxylase-related dioxygenase (phytanoyl-CoA dioxygenase family)